MTDNPKARGFHGPLDVRQAPIHPTVMAEKLALAIEQATGFKEILDYNNPNTPIGPFTRNQYTQKPNGTRESSSTAFLSENVVDEDGFGVNGRKLRVLTKSTALDITFCYKDAIVGISSIQPKSRGTVKIQADDPLKIELGNEGFLDNPADLKLLMNTFKIYVKNIAAKLSAIDPKYQLLSPTLDIINDDVKLENFIRQNLSLTFHEQSTLRMAPSPRDGVVNFKGEVFGVKNLIVADNSIIPFTADGNTSAPAYLIGLTIAQQILAEENSYNCGCY